MSRLPRCLLALAVALPLSAAQPARAPLSYRAPLQEKVFPFFSLLETDPGAARLVREDAALSRLAAAARQRLSTAADCKAEVACLARAFRWQPADLDTAAAALRALYRKHDALRELVDGRMRESGLFELYRDRSGEELLERAFRDAAATTDRVIDQYAEGKATPYPGIDAPMFDVAKENYKALLQTAAQVIEDRRDELVLFFHPPLRFALRLLELNRRDEAARLEPLHLGANLDALQALRSIRWGDYPYSFILVPGSGPDRPTLPLSPWGRLRVELAVKRFREKKAPLLVVSGGYVYPSHTGYCEAVEMKRSLVEDYGVDPKAVLLEPHARHTTTNLRNAARLAYRHGIPFDKPALVTTDAYHSETIGSADFAARCDRELGYQPYRIVKRLSRFDLEFLPRVESLHADTTSPLDP